VAETDQRWERRWHPFRREWVVYAAHRQHRPWHGENAPEPPAVPRHDPTCHLCPGNRRISGQPNPDYAGVYVFDNDHPVVGPEAPAVGTPPGGFFRRTDARGRARVICFSPRHDAHFADFLDAEAEAILLALQAEVRELGALPGVGSVLYFENRGSITGTSNPHPHGQLYAPGFVFRHVETELEALRAEGPALFPRWLEAECADGRRVVAENALAVAVLPFFARYPYEVWLLPKTDRARLADAGEEEVAALGRLHRELCRRYDGLFGSPFPYVCSLYEAPRGVDAPGYRLHFTFLPPLRAPALLKYAAGPEIGGGNFMNDTLPEEKAAELRAVRVPD
jgi:UDPglucose--hexose-1-phosphate uridylyltransferase